VKETINFDALIRANLTRVFGERDVGRRRAALEELYTADAKLYEPDSVFTGRDAICGAVEALIARLPPKVVFAPVGIAVGHHGLGRLAWRQLLRAALPSLPARMLPKSGRGGSSHCMSSLTRNRAERFAPQIPRRRKEQP